MMHQFHFVVKVVVVYFRQYKKQRNDEELGILMNQVGSFNA
jgi:hypothetical protein